VGEESGFRFTTDTPLYRLSPIIPIAPTLVILDIILIALISDGEVIRDTIIIIKSIGVTIGQVIITNPTTMDINDTTGMVATVNIIETIIGRVTINAVGENILTIRSNGKWTGRIKSSTSYQKNRVCGNPRRPFSL
jgi:hypothetical protein